MIRSTRALWRLSSQFSHSKFATLLSQNNEESLQEAADMLVSLETEERTLKAKIQQSKSFINSYKISNNQEIIKELINSLAEVQNENKLVFDRFKKEIVAIDKYGLTRMAKEVLEVADNIKRCVQELKSSNSPNEDLNQAFSALNETFDSVGISQFDPTGEVFDPNTSEAVNEVVDSTKQPGSVAITSQSGYRIHDRVLRFAKVQVVKN